jgi:hypothetical protein
MSFESFNTTTEEESTPEQSDTANVSRVPETSAYLEHMNRPLTDLLSDWNEISASLKKLNSSQESNKLYEIPTKDRALAAELGIRADIQSKVNAFNYRLLLNRKRELLAGALFLSLQNCVTPVQSCLAGIESVSRIENVKEPVVLVVNQYGTPQVTEVPSEEIIKQEAELATLEGELVTVRSTLDRIVEIQNISNKTDKTREDDVLLVQFDHDQGITGGFFGLSRQSKRDTYLTQQITETKNKIHQLEKEIDTKKTSVNQEKTEFQNNGFQKYKHANQALSRVYQEYPQSLAQIDLLLGTPTSPIHSLKQQMKELLEKRSIDLGDIIIPLIVELRKFIASLQSVIDEAQEVIRAGELVLVEKPQSQDGTRTRKVIEHQILSKLEKQVDEETFKRLLEDKGYSGMKLMVSGNNVLLALIDELEEASKNDNQTV